MDPSLLRLKLRFLPGATGRRFSIEFEPPLPSFEVERLRRTGLEELGLDVPTKEYAFTLSVVYRVRGTKTSYGEPDVHTLDSSTYLDPDVTISADDWEDFEVEYVQHDVMDIEEVEE